MARDEKEKKGAKRRREKKKAGEHVDFVFMSLNRPLAIIL